MNNDFDAEELNLVKLAQEYSDEDEARKLLEQLRWPNGPVCPHCKCDGKDKAIYALKPKQGSKTPGRKGLYKCGACRKQFTVTIGTVFEASHIKISTWVMAMFIICSAKKSVSAHQLHRMLGVTYKTAWFMAHRIRFAMNEDDGDLPKMTGHVEVDETFIGPKGNVRSNHSNKVLLMALVERDGQARTRVVSSLTKKIADDVVRANVDKAATLHTDEHPAYKQFKDFAAHKVVNHSKYEYSRVDPDGTKATTNTVEGFFGLFKRGIVGSYHHISHHHLPKYANEYTYRWNQRYKTDGEKFCNFIPLTEGKRLMYRQPKS